MIGSYLVIPAAVTSTQRCCSQTTRQEGEVAVRSISGTEQSARLCGLSSRNGAHTDPRFELAMHIHNVHCTMFSGYSNVTESGAGVWTKWCTAWYKLFDLSFTGFLINGSAGPLTNQV